MHGLEHGLCHDLLIWSSPVRMHHTLLVSSRAASVRSAMTQILPKAYIAPSRLLVVLVAIYRTSLPHPYRAYIHTQIIYMFSPGVKELIHRSSYHAR